RNACRPRPRSDALFGCGPHHGHLPDGVRPGAGRRRRRLPGPRPPELLHPRRQHVPDVRHGEPHDHHRRAGAARRQPRPDDAAAISSITCGEGMSADTPVSRSTLLKLLTEACELEHGLACSYLYSAMTLRQQPDGEKLPPERLPMVRQWASQIYFVASQEMLHLAQAWNLLTALGGTPYYLRPNFPQNTKYYPLHMRLALEPFGERTMTRFVGYETPASLLKEHAFAADIIKPGPEDAANTFRTIGELYDLIETGIAQLPDAIVGDPSAQVGADLVDFPDIVRVVDVDSAHRAIHLIAHQGEGNETDRADCHFGIFVAILEALQAEQRQHPAFSPAHPSMVDPAIDTSEEYGAPHANQIRNDHTREVAALFDGLYSLMLRTLGYTFTPSGNAALRKAFGQSAIVMMAT